MMREAGSFFTIALLLLALCCGYIYSQGGSPFTLAGGGLHISQPPAAGSSVVGGPSLSASKIDSILSSAGSPAAGTGSTFTLDSAQYNIDDAVALAFFHHESSYGEAGMASQTHSIGNIVCTPGYSCIGRFRSYATWSDGIDDWYKLVSGPAYAGGGLVTIPQIIPKYAPNSDNNDESAYIAAVQSDVQSWRSE
jgi:hypothetical protein